MFIFLYLKNKPVKLGVFSKNFFYNVGKLTLLFTNLSPIYYKPIYYQFFRFLIVCCMEKLWLTYKITTYNLQNTTYKTYKSQFWIFFFVLFTVDSILRADEFMWSPRNKIGSIMINNSITDTAMIIAFVDDVFNDVIGVEVICWCLLVIWHHNKSNTMKSSNALSARICLYGNLLIS